MSAKTKSAFQPAVPNESTLVPVACVLLLALATRVAAVLWLSDTVPYSDYFYYHDAARMTADDWGLWFSREKILQYAKLSWWPPGYPMFIASLYEIFGVHHRVIVFAQVLLGTAVCGFVYEIGRRAGGQRLGWIAGILVALNPTYIFMTNLLASENLFVFWLVLGLWLAARTWKQPRAYAWSGGALALAALTRGVGIFVPLIVAGWVRIRAEKKSFGNRSAAWLLAASVLLIAPWSLRNAVVVGSPAIVSHGGGLNFYFGHNEGPLGYRALSETPMRGLRTPGEVDRMATRLALDYLARSPFGFFTRGVQKIAALFEPPRYALQANNAISLPAGWENDPVLTQQVEEVRARQRNRARSLNGVFRTLATVHSYLLVAGALAALVLWKRLPSQIRLCALLALLWLGIHVVFWAQPRFRYPMEIPMALMTATVLAWVPRPRTRRE